jgi:hypothetical protein
MPVSLCGQLLGGDVHEERAFTEMPQRESCRGQRWLPVGYTAASLLIKAVGVLGPMMLHRAVPNNYTFAPAANACAISLV